MANKPRSDLRAGLFILLSLGLICGAVVAIKGVRTVFVHETVRKVRFSLKDNLGGLRLGDDVRLGGYKVGMVDSVDIVGLGSGQEPYVLVRFTLPERYPLAADAHMNVESSLTGTTVLNIDALGTGPVLLADQELVGHPSSFSSVLAELGDAAPDLRQVIATVRNSTLPRLESAVSGVSPTLASFRATSDQVGSVFGDTKPDVRSTMANLHQITDTARNRLPVLLDRANALFVQTTTTINEAHEAMADVRATATNARQLTASARDVVVNNRAKFDGVIASLKMTGDNLKEATAEIRRNPWRLLYHPGAGEMDNLALYDAARQFADGANHVDDAALALKDALQNPSVDRAQVRQLVDRLSESFDHFNGVEQKLWTTVKE
jgi:ABC-type transporter Mla subunit MlaD